MRRSMTVGLALVLVLALGVTAVFAQGPRGNQGWMAGGWGAGANLEAIAEALGMDEAALLDALQDGQTVAEIAEAQGVALEDVIAALTADVAADLAAAVEAGDLSQAQADARLALHAANLEEFLNNQTFAGRFGRFDGMPMLGMRFMAGGNMLDSVAEALGLDADDLIAALQDGQSVADVAEAQGVALEDVSAALLAEASATLAEAVEAGDISQAEADAHLVLMQSHLEAMLTSALPMFSGRMFGGGMFGGMMMRGFDDGDFGRGMMGRDNMPGRGMMDRMPRGGMRGGF